MSKSLGWVNHTFFLKHIVDRDNEYVNDQKHNHNFHITMNVCRVCFLTSDEDQHKQ